MKTDDYYTDEEMGITPETITCPKCKSSIEPNIYATLQHVPDAKYLVCGMCEVQLVFIRPGDTVKYPSIKDMPEGEKDVAWYSGRITSIEGKTAHIVDADSGKRIRCDIAQLKAS